MEPNTQEIKYRVGEEIEVELDTVAFGGEAVGRINELVVFVRGALDGEKVLARIYEIKKNYIKAETTEVLRASSERVKPLCPVFGPCGGCQYQHVSYPKQLLLKEAQVRDAIERIGKIKDFELKPIIPSPHAYHYRSRVEFHIRKIEGQLKMGYKRFSDKRLIDVTSCPIASVGINDAYKEFYQAVCTQNEGAENLPSWVRFSRFWDTAEGVRMFHHSLDGRVAYEGEPFIMQEVLGKKFRAMHDSFFQVNLAMIEKMITCVQSILDLKETDFLLDCYSGVGLFAVFLARLVRRCVGVESDNEASKNALYNACDNGLMNCEFIGKSVEKVLKNAESFLGEKPNKVILDPARPGCTNKVLHAISYLRPERIAYVSCNPPTLARDIEFFTRNGYRLGVVYPLDMFPQTKHCEVIAELSLSP